MEVCGRQPKQHFQTGGEKMAKAKEVNLDQILDGERTENNRDGTITLPKKKKNKEESSSLEARLRKLIAMLMDEDEEEKSTSSDRSSSRRSSRKRHSSLIGD